MATAVIAVYIVVLVALLPAAKMGLEFCKELYSYLEERYGW